MPRPGGVTGSPPRPWEVPRPWEAEREVGPEEARALVDARFPRLAPARVRPLGAGWDNTAFAVNDDWVVRFPRRQAAVAWLRAEIRVLPALARRLPLPVPVPLLVAEPAGRYPWPFAGYRMLPGRTLDAAGLDDAGRVGLAEPLARFLAALHAVDADEGRRMGAAGDDLGRFDVAARAPRALDGLRRVAALGLGDHVGALARALEPACALPRARACALVHGDLYARHLLVDAAGAIAGVIDWSDVHVGEPATDLAVAHSVLPPAAHDRFVAAYGRVDEETWALARFRAVYHTVSVVLYAHDVGDRTLLEEGRGALARLAGGAAPPAASRGA